MGMPLWVLVAFCRLQALIFIEDETRDGTPGYAFLDYTGRRLWYSDQQIYRLLD